MGKIISASQKISSHQQELPIPNFKSFNNALKEKKLFLADGKSMSTSRNDEFIKKYVST